MLNNSKGDGYAGLHSLCKFSIRRGASREELVAQAQSLGYGGLALTDECSLSRLVRPHF